MAFSDRAEVIVPSTRELDRGKQETRIEMLQPSGGTEVFAGLSLGYNEIVKNFSHFQVNHLIMLTDGRTYGDENKCLKLAEQANEQGIGISALGIGSEWNDNFLDQLASITGGGSMCIANPHIEHALLDRFNQLGNEYVEEIKGNLKSPLMWSYDMPSRLNLNLACFQLKAPYAWPDFVG